MIHAVYGSNYARSVIMALSFACAAAVASDRVAEKPGGDVRLAAPGATAPIAGPHEQADAVLDSEPYQSIFEPTESLGPGVRASVTKIHGILARRLEATPLDHAVKAWVLFKDKSLTSRSDYDSAIRALGSTYNRRAIQRRVKRRTRPGLFDEHDLPVAPAYIAQVEAGGARVHIVSKWVNSVSVYATKAQLERIEQLDFVKVIEPVRRAPRLDPVEDRRPHVDVGEGTTSRTALVGGDTCASATVIPSIPFNEFGNTSGFANDYGEICPSDSSGAPDVVYSFTPGADVSVDIRLCNGSNFETTLYVYETTCPDGGPFACGEPCSAPGWIGSSAIFDLALTEGITYYIVIDGASGSQGLYALEITEATVYGRSNEQLEEMNLIAVHDLGFTGNDVIVGVLDTGFWTTHEAFNDPTHPLNIVAAWDFVGGDGEVGSGNHGTMVLSTIGAYKPDVLMGGAYDASFILCRTEDTSSESPAEEDNYVAALEFVEANGGDMATASLSYLNFDDPADSYTQEDLDGLTAISTIGVNVATGNGMHCLNSAGNAGHDLNPTTSHLGAPADAFQVLTVGAVYGTGEIASFSSDGPSADGRVKPEILARGFNTSVVRVGDDTAYSTAAGTSFSAPLAAAAVACLIDAHPDWTVDKMRQALFATADYYVAHGTHDPFHVLGYGIIDALATMQHDCNGNGISDECDIDCGTPAGLCDVLGCGTIPDCNGNGIPDECENDCNDNGIPDDCDIANSTSPDLNGNGIPDECDGCVEDVDCSDGLFCNGEERCASASCVNQPNPCPASCDEENDTCLSPLALPTIALHRRLKHRYISINPTANPNTATVIKVEVAEMMRCQNDPRRACTGVNDDCPMICDGADPRNRLCPAGQDACTNANAGDCIPSGPCIDATPSPPVAWLVQEPYQHTDACLAPGCNPATENCCDDEDWVARLSDVVYVDANNWQDHDLIHIADCGISPGITYAVYACDPANPDNCSAPLLISTQKTPSGTPRHFGDIGGPVVVGDPDWQAPDGFLGVFDASAWQTTFQNYGTTAHPKVHITMADLHGPGLGIPPQYILNLSDFVAFFNHALTWYLPWDNPSMLGGVSPSACPGRLP